MTMICSTLSGIMAIKHPTLGVLVREDGSVLNRVKGNTDKYGWMKGWVEKDGYSRIKIQGKPYSVHRLVAETFISNPENKPTVDHINRNRSDNRVCNLRWATYKEQNDNRKCVDISFEKYGVRSCENRTGYYREYRKAHRDEQREYKRKRKWIKEMRNKCGKFIVMHTCYKCGKVDGLGVSSAVNMSFLCLDCLANMLFEKTPSLDVKDFTKI